MTEPIDDPEVMASVLTVGRRALAAKELQPSSLALLLSIASYMTDLRDSCHVAEKVLAVESGISPSTVQRHLDKLIGEFITYEPGTYLPDGSQGINTYFLGPRFFPTLSLDLDEATVKMTEVPLVKMTKGTVPNYIRMSSEREANKNLRTHTGPIPDVLSQNDARSDSSEIKESAKAETDEGASVNVKDMNLQRQADNLLAKSEPQAEPAYDPFYDDVDRQASSFGSGPRQRTDDELAAMAERAIARMRERALL